MSCAGLEDETVERLPAVRVSVVVEDPGDQARPEVRPLVVSQHKPGPRPGLAAHTEPAPRQAGEGDWQPPLGRLQQVRALLLPQTLANTKHQHCQHHLGYNSFISELFARKYEMYFYL